jgi:hypothetical protein
MNTELNRNKINAYVWLINYRQFGRTQDLNAAIESTRAALRAHLKGEK